AIRKELQGNNARVAETLNNLGNLLRRLGKLSEAETLHREALNMRRALFGEDSPKVVNSLDNLAIVLRAAGNLEEAASKQREAIGILRRQKNSGTDLLINQLVNLARILEDQGRLKEAETNLLDALSKGTVAGSSRDTADNLEKLGTLLLKQN